MKAPRFEYARPETLGAALGLLAEHGDAAAVLAGGQSLMPMLNLRMAQPRLLLDINRIGGLDAIGVADGHLVIGALARHRDVLASPLVAGHAPLLAEALGHVAHAAIRNRGTFGGSLALADPAAELPACVVCLGATIVTASVHGERELPADRFFSGLYETARRPDELILRVAIPLRPAWRFTFREVARRHGDYAIAGLAMGMAEGACRVTFCGVETAPRRLPAIEAAILAGATPDLGALQPMSSDDAPASLRKHLAGVLLHRSAEALRHG